MCGPASIEPHHPAMQGEEHAAHSLLAASTTLLAEVIDRRAGASNGEALSCFESPARPRLQLHEYARMLDKHFDCCPVPYVLSLVYVERLFNLNPDFTVTPFSVQKMFLTSLVVAVKFHDDEFMTNQHYAHVGGLRTRDFNILEARFLEMIKWRLVVSPQEFRTCLDRILSATDTSARDSLMMLFEIDKCDDVEVVPVECQMLDHLAGRQLPNVSCEPPEAKWLAPTQVPVISATEVTQRENSTGMFAAPSVAVSKVACTSFSVLCASMVTLPQEVCPADNVYRNVAVCA